MFAGRKDPFSFIELLYITQLHRLQLTKSSGWRERLSIRSLNIGMLREVILEFSQWFEGEMAWLIF